MTSPSPLLYNSYYHIYNRGNNRENIFVEERNYAYFLNLFEKHVAPVADLYAYCLLRNHFHMLVRVKPEEEIKSRRVSETLRDSNPEKPLGSDYPSKKFSDFFNAYAKAINKAYNRTGSLFQHPFGRVLVTSDRQFWNVIAYIHQNSQNTNLWMISGIGNTRRMGLSWPVRPVSSNARRCWSGLVMWMSIVDWTRNG